MSTTVAVSGLRSFSEMPIEPLNENAARFASVCRALFEEPTVLDTLRMIVDIAVTAVDGCDGVGISLIDGDTVVTPAWTSLTMLEIDNMQYVSGQGPCLDAIVQGGPFYSPDLLTDERWPIFGPLAAAAGMRSLFSCRLFGVTTLGALNMYGSSPNAYSASARALGIVLASHAGMALGAVGAQEAASAALEVETTQLENLQGALTSREIIGQAEGVLMHSESITPEQAFTRLREVSQKRNIKLRDVAQYVVDNGELQTTAP